MTMYFAEYMAEGSGIPVDVTVGARSKAHLIKHAIGICATKGYCGFWVSSKREGEKVLPKRLEFHPIRKDPSGKRIVRGKVIYV